MFRLASETSSSDAAGAAQRLRSSAAPANLHDFFQSIFGRSCSRGILWGNDCAAAAAVRGSAAPSVSVNGCERAGSVAGRHGFRDRWARAGRAFPVRISERGRCRVNRNMLDHARSRNLPDRSRAEIIGGDAENNSDRKTAKRKPADRQNSPPVLRPLGPIQIQAVSFAHMKSPFQESQVATTETRVRYRARS